MQPYRGSGSIVPLILNLGTRWKLHIPIEEEARLGISGNGYCREEMSYLPLLEFEDRITEEQK
jgi:hypothetical protein